MVSSSQPSPATKNTAPKMLTREIVFVLRWKTCDILLVPSRPLRCSA